jgi:predicted small lipoprotein YifL
MKNIRIVVGLLLIGLLAAGCGQRGPLVKPKPPEPLQKPESKTQSNPENKQAQ